MLLIEITRGDHKSYKFLRKTKDGEIITEKPQKMYFTVKKSFYQSEFLFQKRLDEGITYTEQDYYYHFEIKPEDTDGLNFGDDYVFDIEIIEQNGKKKTIAKGKIKITEEVTFAENEG